MRDAGDKWSAALASVHVSVKLVLLGGREKAVEVVAQAKFGFFTVQFIKHPARDPNSRWPHPIC